MNSFRIARFGRALFLVAHVVIASVPTALRADTGTADVDVAQSAVYYLGTDRNDAEVLFQLTNTGQDTITLVGAACPDATSATVHTTIIVEGKKAIRNVDAYNIPPGGSVRMATGGMHLMLNNMKRPLKAGDQTNITLKFKGGAEYTFRAVVKVRPPEMPPHPH